MTESFDLNAGGSSTSFSFGPQGSQPGAWISGTVVDMKQVQETNFDTKKPEFWENGEPKLQIRLTLATDLRDPATPNDDGKRDVYLNGYKKPHPTTGTSSTIYAAMEAVKAATGGTEIQRGGWFAMKWLSGMGFTGDPRHYQAQYKPPAMDIGGQPPAQTAPVMSTATGVPVVHQQQVPVPPAAQQIVQQAPAAAPDPWAGAPAWAAPQAAAAPQLAQPVAPPAQPAFVQTPQGVVNTATGELQQAPTQAAPAAPGQPTPEQLAALNAAGVTDPAAIAQIYPGYTPVPAPA